MHVPHICEKHWCWKRIGYNILFSLNPSPEHLYNIRPKIKIEINERKLSHFFLKMLCVFDPIIFCSEGSRIIFMCVCVRRYDASTSLSTPFYCEKQQRCERNMLKYYFFFTPSSAHKHTLAKFIMFNRIEIVISITQPLLELFHCEHFFFIG